MKQQNAHPVKPTDKKTAIPRLLYMGYMMACMSVMLVQPAAAASTIWEKASEIMQDVYTQILTISTIAAIVTASVALLPWVPPRQPQISSEAGVGCLPGSFFCC